MKNPYSSLYYISKKEMKRTLLAVVCLGMSLVWILKDVTEFMKRGFDKFETELTLTVD